MIFFKTHFGRARPQEITQFGGDAIFTRAFEVSEAYISNTSFVCTYCSAAFFLIAFALFIEDREVKKQDCVYYGEHLGCAC